MRPKKRPNTIRKNKRNEQILASKVRLIDQSGENRGVISRIEAQKIANSARLDLVQVSKESDVPVCRIIDYNKYTYEQKSKQKKTKKTNLKEFQLSPKIAEGDLKVRIERGKEFLREGHMVKYTVKLKGRENKYPEIAELKLKIIESELIEDAKVDKPAKREGNQINITFAPKKK